MIFSAHGVIIEDGYDYWIGEGNKYIIATYDCGDPIFYAGNASASEHQELLDQLVAESVASHALAAPSGCAGGGRLWICASRKEIYIWDDSVRYGPDDKNKTAQILKQAFPDFSVLQQEPPRP